MGGEGGAHKLSECDQSVPLLPLLPASCWMSPPSSAAAASAELRAVTFAGRRARSNGRGGGEEKTTEQTACRSPLPWKCVQPRWRRLKRTPPPLIYLFISHAISPFPQSGTIIRPRPGRLKRHNSCLFYSPG